MKIYISSDFCPGFGYHLPLYEMHLKLNILLRLGFRNKSFLEYSMKLSAINTLKHHKNKFLIIYKVVFYYSFCGLIIAVKS